MNTNIQKAIKLLRAGELVGIPTETVYGLAADGSNIAAIKKIFVLKGRPMSTPLSILIPKNAPLTQWAVDIPDIAYELAKKHWPGPLTIILKKAPHIDKLITAGKDTIGLRCPDHPIALEILNHFPQGLAAPSANPYGEEPPTTAEEVKKYFGNKLKLIINGDKCRVGLASTIVDLSNKKIKILRQGAIMVDASLCSFIHPTQ